MRVTVSDIANLMERVQELTTEDILCVFHSVFRVWVSSVVVSPVS